MKTLNLVLITLLCYACKAPEKHPSDSAHELTEILTQISDSSSIRGFAVAIVKEDCIVYSKGFGYSNVSSNQAYTRQSTQNIGSVSKVIIGISLLKAQEMGLLRLEDSINKYLPFEVKNPNYPEYNITIGQLANHTSSIVDSKLYDKTVYVLAKHNRIQVPQIEVLEGLYNPTESRLSLQQYLTELLDKDGKWHTPNNYASFAPGTEYAYSNVGAALVALVLENATGMSYPEFTATHILKPLAMNNSGWNYEDLEENSLSNLYYDTLEIPHYNLQSYPDGGLLSSGEDLSKLLRELIRGYSGNGSLLKPSS